MNSSQVITQAALSFKLLAANLALVTWAIIAMNSPYMYLVVVLSFKFPAANLALVSGVRMLWSRPRRWRRRSGVALSMRRVVVSADR